MAEWCNGQPRKTQNLPRATSWGFGSDLGHHLPTSQSNQCKKLPGAAIRRSCFLENDENSHVFNASFYFVESHSLVVKENQFGRAAFPIHSSSRVIRFNFRCARFSADESVFHIYLGGFVAVRQPRFDRGSDTGGFRLSFIYETRSAKTAETGNRAL